MKTAFLLVTCCLEPLRTEVLSQVIDNLNEQAPELKSMLTVFDNASTDPRAQELLTKNFDQIYVADRNVGYWSAINWWLSSYNKGNVPDFVYVIESDMLHYAWNKFPDCVALLANHPELGGVRLHEYSVENYALYNKDKPRQDSKFTNWQSHTNKVTNEKVRHQPLATIGNSTFYTTNFLTQLPALNRFEPMLQAFQNLRERNQFSELDFQKLYHEHYPTMALLDGGLYDGGKFAWDPKFKPMVSSWMSDSEFQKTGYQPTRYATITSVTDFNTKLIT